MRNAEVRIRPPQPASPGSVPDTWVTVYSGDMGNTFAPKGFSAFTCATDSFALVPLSVRETNARTCEAVSQKRPVPVSISWACTRVSTRHQSKLHSRSLQMRFMRFLHVKGQGFVRS